MHRAVSFSFQHFSSARLFVSLSFSYTNKVSNIFASVSPSCSESLSLPLCVQSLFSVPLYEKDRRHRAVSSSFPVLSVFLTATGCRLALYSDPSPSAALCSAILAEDNCRTEVPSHDGCRSGC